MTVEERRGSMVSEDESKDRFPVGMRVLAVDDDPTCLRVLETLLRRCQYHGLILLFYFIIFFVLLNLFMSFGAYYLNFYLDLLSDSLLLDLSSVTPDGVFGSWGMLE
ncbi:hypothetical protein HHK36_025884 [Tetracentron sinense]|uniref:Uncharacterized protein n=1 Tax=Tetracentron sinense TaxID=13715 RepID=A0A835D3Y8_TETSI|nr:hypothetical protein HHK36_025884 [Tetracentron sinense]